MYNKLLSTFLSVAETGSFSRTAALLYITPSAVNQQVTRLEQELGAALFKRGRHGLTLTPAGLYLKEQAGVFIRLGDEIAQRVREIDRQDSAVTIGTDIDQKVRFLFDLWMRYPERNRGQTINLVNINAARGEFHGAQLIESVRDESPWTGDWTFLEMLRVPYGCGFSRNHPLHGRERISPEDLRPYPLIFPRQGAGDERRQMEEELRERGIVILERDSVGAPVIWEASEYLYPLVVPLIWSDILYDIDIVACDWPYTIPYGVYCREPLSGPAKEFLAYIREACESPGDLLNVQLHVFGKGGRSL